MTHIVDVNDAKEQLQQLLDAVARGEDVTIARDGVPCAKLVAVPNLRAPSKRQLGLMAGLFPPIPDEAFFEPISKEELADWEDGPVFPPN